MEEGLERGRVCTSTTKNDSRKRAADDTEVTHMWPMPSDSPPRTAGPIMSPGGRSPEAKNLESGPGERVGERKSECGCECRMCVWRLWICVEIARCVDVKACMCDDFDLGEEKDDAEGRTVGMRDVRQHVEMAALVVVGGKGVAGIHFA
jgi:hypothetical protein